MKENLIIFFLFMKSNYFFLWNAGDVVTGSDAQVSVPVQTLTDLQGTVTMATYYISLPAVLYHCLLQNSIFLFAHPPFILSISSLPLFSHWVALLFRTKVPSHAIPWWCQIWLWCGFSIKFVPASFLTKYGHYILWLF